MSWEVFIHSRDMWFAIFILPVCILVFYSLKRVFDRAKQNTFWLRFNINFSFYGSCFFVTSLRTLCVALDVKIFFQWCFLKVLQFCIFHLSSWSKLNKFFYDRRVLVKVYFFLSIEVQLLQYHLLKSLSFIELILYLSKNQSAILTWVAFWVPNCVPLTVCLSLYQ